MKHIIPIIFFCLLTSCTKVPDDIDITVDTPSKGMISGRVVYPTIVDNKLGYKGLKGATVKVVNTDFSVTTSENGVYAIDGIPTGSYTIKATWNDQMEYSPSEQGVVVTRQNTSTVPDIQMGIGLNRSVIYGRAYYNDKTTVFSNKEIRLASGGVPVTRVTTSDNGDYGFDIKGEIKWCYLEHLDETLHLIGFRFGIFSYITGYAYSGIIKVDAFYYYNPK
jgi:hypothetical protein